MIAAVAVMIALVLFLGWLFWPKKSTTLYAAQQRDAENIVLAIGCAGCLMFLLKLAALVLLCWGLYEGIQYLQTH